LGDESHCIESEAESKQVVGTDTSKISVKEQRSALFRAQATSGVKEGKLAVE
jgi:hypothetical protein